MNRRAFTLVEILVAAAIGTTILAAVMAVFSLSNRSRGVTATARSLQTALLFQERFCEDLARLMPAASSPVQFAPEKPARLSFYAYDPDAGTDGGVTLRPVSYSVDAGTNLLVREWNGARETVGVAPVKTLVFAPFMSPTGPLVRVTLSVGRAPGDPDGPPTAHSFLARIPAPAQDPRLDVAVPQGFRDAADEPGDRALPGP